MVFNASSRYFQWDSSDRKFASKINMIIGISSASKTAKKYSYSRLKCAHKPDKYQKFKLEVVYRTITNLDLFTGVNLFTSEY